MIINLIVMGFDVLADDLAILLEDKSFMDEVVDVVAIDFHNGTKSMAKKPRRPSGPYCVRMLSEKLCGSATDSKSLPCKRSRA